jgi:hypothetical protein
MLMSDVITNRYLLYLKSLRKVSASVEEQIYSDFGGKPLVVMNQWVDEGDNTENTSMETNANEEVNFFDFDAVNTSMTRKTKGKERRATLSPASARAAIGEIDKRRQSMDLELLPIEDYEENTKSAVLPVAIDDFTVAVTFEKVVVLPLVETDCQESTTFMVEHSDEDKEMDDFKNELDALLADDDTAIAFNEIPSTRRQSILSPIRHHVIDVLIASPTQQSEPNHASSPVLDPMSVLPNDCFSQKRVTGLVDVPVVDNERLVDEPTSSASEPGPSEDIEDAEPLSREEYLRMQHEKAYSRMRLRMEQSWWKYQWEVVSSHAVVFARDGDFTKKQ